jgi:hypothetical protein
VAWRPQEISSVNSDNSCSQKDKSETEWTVA